jgi:hypothetical protein
MAHRVTTREGKKLDAVPKQIPRTGVAMLGFRQFLQRGLDKTRGEWRLLTGRCSPSAPPKKALGCGPYTQNSHRAASQRGKCWCKIQRVQNKVGRGPPCGETAAFAFATLAYRRLRRARRLRPCGRTPRGWLLFGFPLRLASGLLLRGLARRLLRSHLAHGRPLLPSLCSHRH